MKPLKLIIATLLFVALLSGCAAVAQPEATPSPAATVEPTPTLVLEPTVTTQITPTPTPSPVVTVTPTEEPEEGDEEKSPKQLLLESALVGFWHAAPGVPAGYAERYFFFINRKFIWTKSQMNSTTRMLSMRGTWEISDNSLILNIENTYTLIGGELVPNPMYSSGYSLEGTTVQYNINDPPETVIYPEFTIHKDAELSGRYPYYIELGDEQYWKFDAFDDLANYLNGEIDVWMPTEYPD